MVKITIRMEFKMKIMFHNRVDFKRVSRDIGKE